MKILHFISGGDSGGAKTHVLTLLDNLRKLNIEVELLCIMEGVFTEEAREMGIPVTIIPQEKRWDLSVLSKVKKFINNCGCDLVHCHGARANYISLFIRGGVKVPMITTLHSDYKLDFKDNPRKQLIYTPINAFALRRYKHILAVTKAFKYMLMLRGFKEERIDVIYNGIDFSQELQTYDMYTFFKNINVPHDLNKKYVGIAARLFAVKGVNVFLDMAKIIADKREDIDFIILGNGEMWQQCQGFIKENKLENRVYMAGQVSDPVIMNSYYKYIDVNTLTSYSESFPYALLEGARCKCATVATAVGGIPEMIIDGESGCLVQSGDSKALAECVEMLCDKDDIRIRYGVNFYERAKENFSSQAMANTHKKIYEKIIKENVK